MSNEIGSRVRYGEAFWRAHHEAWRDLRRQAVSLRRSEFEMNRVRHRASARVPMQVPRGLGSSIGMIAVI